MQETVYYWDEIEFSLIMISLRKASAHIVECTSGDLYVTKCKQERIKVISEKIKCVMYLG